MALDDNLSRLIDSLDIYGEEFMRMEAGLKNMYEESMFAVYFCAKRFVNAYEREHPDTQNSGAE